MDPQMKHDPKILVHHIPEFLPQCEVITRLMAADVRLLDVYAAWCALDSNVFLGGWTGVRR